VSTRTTERMRCHEQSFFSLSSLQRHVTRAVRDSPGGVGRR
jgi:hypothetical protein